MRGLGKLTIIVLEKHKHVLPLLFQIRTMYVLHKCNCSQKVFEPEDDHTVSCFLYGLALTCIMSEDQLESCGKRRKQTDALQLGPRKRPWVTIRRN